ncbi:MAG: Flp pilus assembly protein CpaB [Gammaproteobacteria bacterium]|nr:Flp pilus assembly protein CpaB [Gammaproteobacteria bacterium]
MKFRTFIVFVFALVLAGGAAWFANRWIQLQVKPVSADSNPTAMIVVAAQTVPMGAKIVDTHLQLAAWPADRVLEGSFTEMDEIKGQVAAQTIYKGEAILKERIAEHSTGSTLSALIDKRKRAVTVRVNDVVGVAGFVLPGNTVDVLATRKTAKSKARVDTVLQNMKVLAVDQTTGGKDQPVVVRAVTLEVTPDEAEELIKAKSEGGIQLALRNTLDTDISPPPPAPRAKPRSRPRPANYITVIRGTAVSQVKQ